MKKFPTIENCKTYPFRDVENYDFTGAVHACRLTGHAKMKFYTEGEVLARLFAACPLEDV